ncbi:hypothetical protein P7K49_015302, partial [Saguinus oedipus]
QSSALGSSGRSAHPEALTCSLTLPKTLLYVPLLSPRHRHSRSHAASLPISPTPS